MVKRNVSRSKSRKKRSKKINKENKEYEYIGTIKWAHIYYVPGDEKVPKGFNSANNLKVFTPLDI